VREENLEPDADELQRIGLYDPNAPQAAEHLELLRYVMAQGATLGDMAAATNLGQLALDRTIRPRGRLTLREVAASAGIDWPTAERLITAVGFGADPDAPVTEYEAATVRLLAGANNDLLGQEATLQLARVTGSAMARLAEAVVGLFRLRVELPWRAAGMPYVDIVKEYADLTETLIPAFVTTLEAVLRRQIVAVAERMWSTDAEQSIVMLQRTIGFVDLVGYTSATSALSLRELTDVLIEFDARTSDAVARGHGQIVKMIGDEAMFLTEEAEDACRIALDLVDASGGTLPPVRVGLATGDMVSVFGDVYGHDVNLAARLVEAAEPSTVVVSEQVRSAAGGFRYELLPPLTLKGFAQPTTAYRVRR
jgi:adenylate cyclase